MAPIASVFGLMRKRTAVLLRKRTAVLFLWRSLRFHGADCAGRCADEAPLPSQWLLGLSTAITGIVTFPFIEGICERSP